MGCAENRSCKHFTQHSLCSQEWHRSNAAITASKSRAAAPKARNICRTARIARPKEASAKNAKPNASKWECKGPLANISFTTLMPKEEESRLEPYSDTFRPNSRI